jgi:Uncharacterized alpha/beta hydrolase domain (DUF2235)
MLYIVDGTGSDKIPFWRDYKRLTRKCTSECAIECELNLTARQQFTAEAQVCSIFLKHLERQRLFLRREIKKNSALHKQPLFLAGHSRGGAAVVWVANLLKRDAIEVDGMFLFDAVDRTTSPRWLMSVDRIPANLKFVAHALQTLALIYQKAAIDARDRFFKCRDTNRGRGCEEERRIAETYIKFDDAMKVRTRAGGDGLLNHGIDFGNCGTAYEGERDKFKHRIFPGSHGAIGGSPNRLLKNSAAFVVVA